MVGQPKLHKLALLGDPGVGKSSLTLQFVHGYFTSECLDPTLEDVYQKRVLIDNRSHFLELMDTAAHEDCACHNYQINDRAGFLLVYSITSRESFSGVQTVHAPRLQRLKNFSEAPLPAATSDLPPYWHVPVILVGNKVDQSDEREVSSEEGQALAEKLRCPFVETSAKDGSNLEKAFFDVAKRLIALETLATQSSAPEERFGQEPKGTTLGTLWR